MFVYIPDWKMFYTIDAFRRDVKENEVILTVCDWRMEIIIKNADRRLWTMIRRDILHNYYFELSSDFEWDLALVCNSSHIRNDFANSCRDAP